MSNLPPPNFRQIHHLTSAYRVGLLALDTLARRAHEPNQAKYSRNPPFREDIQWLLRLSKKLGMCFKLIKNIGNTYKKELGGQLLYIYTIYFSIFVK